jgi:hypothetical protein
MNAHNDVKRPSDQSLDAKPAMAAVQLRFAALVDFRVARWLERCATNAEVAQRRFKTDRKPAREHGTGCPNGPNIYQSPRTQCLQHQSRLSALSIRQSRTLAVLGSYDQQPKDTTDYKGNAWLELHAVNYRRGSCDIIGHAGA